MEYIQTGMNYYNVTTENGVTQTKLTIHRAERVQQIPTFFYLSQSNVEYRTMKLKSVYS